MSNKQLRPYLLILIAGLLWGVTFSFALIATSQGAHPLAISLWQTILTGFFFLVVCLVIKIPFFRKRSLRHYIVLAIIGITVPNLAYYYAAPHLSAGILAITVSTVPLFTYALMMVLRLESMAVKRVCGIVVGMIAILLLVIPDQGLSSDDANFWILLALLSAVLYAIENVYIGRSVEAYVDIRELLCGSNIIASIILIPLTIGLGVAEPVSWLFTDAGMALFALAVASGLAYSMFFYTIKKSGPVFASQCAYIVTISGVLWGIFLFSEEHSIWVWSSVVVVLIGLALVAPDDSASNIDPDPVSITGG